MYTVAFFQTYPYPSQKNTPVTVVEFDTAKEAKRFFESKIVPIEGQGAAYVQLNIDGRYTTELNPLVYPFEVLYFGGSGCYKTFMEPVHDQCWTGIPCRSLDEARAVLAGDPPNDCITWIKYKVITSTNPHVDFDYVIEINPHYQESKDSDNDWLVEQAMQNGMAYGIQGYNDTMGY